jgi:hypothetical protein
MRLVKLGFYQLICVGPGKVLLGKVRVRL